MIFFSKNQKTAKERIRKLAQTENKYKGKTPVLASTQIKHSSRWKTWILK